MAEGTPEVLSDGGPDDSREPLLGSDERWSVLRKLIQYKTYRRRWYLLGVVCLLNCSNAMLWLSFAPVADQMANYYGCTLDKVNWLSQVYLIISIPFGLGTMWVLDMMGLKTSVILSSWLNMIGSIVRFFSVFGFVPKELRYPALIVGQCFSAMAQPLVLFCPAKLAALWFPEHQRATANMIASMSNPLGILLANVLSPALASTKGAIPLMIGMYAIPAVWACILATAGVCHSEPPTPPSASAINSTSEPFLTGLKKILRNKAFVILMVTFGAGIGLFTAFSALLEQILCVVGYSNAFAGLCGAMFIAFGIVGAFLLGLYIDKTKKFTVATKICFSAAALSSIAFALVSRLPKQAAWLAVICSLFGFFGFSTYPIAMELAVECSYPVGEGTSTGLVFISGQIQGIIYMLLFQAVTIQLADAPLSTCNNGLEQPLDWKVSTLLLAGIFSLMACCFVFFFRTDYKRLHIEATSAAITEREAEPA